MDHMSSGSTRDDAGGDGDRVAGRAIVVRATTLEDYSRVGDVLADTLEFHRQALPDVFRLTNTPPPTADFITDLLREGTGAFLVAEAEGAVIGFLTIRAAVVDQPYLVPRRVGIIDNVGVAPAWRHHGVERALMAAAHDWARGRRLTQVRLSVWEFNGEAIAFYESLGYRTTSRNMWVTL